VDGREEGEREKGGGRGAEMFGRALLKNGRSSASVKKNKRVGKQHDDAFRSKKHDANVLV
jgi:hypothetical protein